jgi:hypothetical protein
MEVAPLAVVVKKGVAFRQANEWGATPGIFAKLEVPAKKTGE